jgi:molecular chaperone DnaJ
MVKEDYYKILGVDKTATESDIKKAYRKQAIKFHPDKNPDDPSAEEKFKEAAEAYEYLSDPQKKQRYDQFGHQTTSGRGHSHNMEDIFSHFGDIFGGRSNPFGGFSRRTNTGANLNKGSNISVAIDLDIFEIAKGTKKDIVINKQVIADGVTFKPCETCGGVGQVERTINTMIGTMVTASICPTCTGTGQIVDKKPEGADDSGFKIVEEVISVTIPSGVVDGMQLTIAGRGNDSQNGGAPGDVFIAIHEIEHDQLKRVNNNINYDLRISFIDAVLGESIDVPTVNGTVKIKIDAGTQSGKVLRLQGKGIAAYNGGVGDQFIRINVWTPTTLYKHERKILEDLKDSQNFK